LFNLKYALGFVMRVVIERKSGYLEAEASPYVRDGEVESSNAMTDFKAIAGRNNLCAVA
jgi:hypothetical protein